jgi:hypothetical protein
MKRIALALIVLAGCSAHWNDAIPTRVGDERWHPCGGGLYCRQWEACARSAGPPACAFVGDPNGPGPGDSAQDTSEVNAPDR